MRNTMFTGAPSNSRQNVGQVAVTASRNDGHIIGLRTSTNNYGGGGRIGVSVGGAGRTTFHGGGSFGGFHGAGGGGGFHSNTSVGFSGSVPNSAVRARS